MAYAPPSPTQMFGTDDPVKVATRFEAYKSALADTHDHTEQTRMRWTPGVGVQETGRATKLDEAIADIEKSVGPDVLASLAGSLDAMRAMRADLTKDWTTTAPLATGLVAFDLQAPAKMLIPHETPISNEVPRNQGVGLAARFKRILGFSNAGVGGVADVRPSFDSEAITNTFGGVSGLRRPNKISYASDEKVVLYKEVGLSDSVTFKAEHTSRGYQNLRSLSQTALLWATKLGQEKMFLYGRGTSTGFEGALAAPTATSVTATTPGAGQTGNTANVANLFIYVTAKNGTFGESVASTVLNSTAFSAVTGKTATVTWTDSVGALGYNVYMGTTTGIANAWFAGTTQTNSAVISFTGAGTGGVPSVGAQPPAADTSATSADYDGFLTIQSDPTVSGYVARLNGLWGTSNPGGEIQTAFSAMWNANRADPAHIWTYAGGRVGLSDLLKTASSANYRIEVTNSDANSGVRLGSMVTGVANEITGTMADIRVHPFMPAGVMLLRSETLPFPDSEIAGTTEFRYDTDYLGIEWPAIQMTYDASTWILGSLIHYAPAWSGVILGIAN